MLKYNKPEEKQYLNIIRKIQDRHGIQTQIFSLMPNAVKFDNFIHRCEACMTHLESRPTYVLKIPNDKILKIKYLCKNCAGKYTKYIVYYLILKN